MYIARNNTITQSKRSQTTFFLASITEILSRLYFNMKTKQPTDYSHRVIDLSPCLIADLNKRNLYLKWLPVSVY